MIPEAPDAHPGLRGEGLNCKLAEKIRTSNIQRPTSNVQLQSSMFAFSAVER
jgi:hypothetical protein